MAIKKISANLLGNNAVTAASIAGGAISAADIADNSITAAKISTSTFAIDSLTVNTSDLVVDTANNRVGIGTASPATTLAINGATQILAGNALYFQNSAADANGTISGSGGAGENTLSFNSGAMVLNASGNVGIGGSPLDALHIQSAVTTDYRGNLLLSDTTAIAAGVGGQITFGGKFSGSSLTEWAAIQGTKDNATSGEYGGSLELKTRAHNGSMSTKMFVSSSGDVGIGGEPVSSYSGYNGAALHVRQSSTSATAGSQLRLTNGQTGHGVADGSYLSQWGDLDFYIVNQENANMRFYTNATERMRIDSSGTILVGKTTTSSNVEGIILSSNDFIQATRSGGICLSANRRDSTGTIQNFEYNGSQVGTISVTASSTAYNTSSDYRLKENVIEMEGAIDRVKLLQPKRFNFIADETDTTVDGFLAHEVQDIVPEAIHGIKDEVDEEGNPVYQGIDQSKLVPLLTKAIQEQQTIIDDLKSRLESAGL